MVTILYMNSLSKTNKQTLGQYFTSHPDLQHKVCEFILHRPSVILEPSVGRGDLVVAAFAILPDARFDMYEIDSTIPLLPPLIPQVAPLIPQVAPLIPQVAPLIHHHITYCDFLTQVIETNYQTIIGNPPFVRTKKGNLYIDFVQKCVELLTEQGELVFVVPSDFFTRTSSAPLLEDMMAQGTFTHVYHPHKEHLFEDAAIDVVVFRYCKDITLPKQTLYNDEIRHVVNRHGLVSFVQKSSENLETQNIPEILVQDVFDVYVGMVSGKEQVYKHSTLGNIQVLNGENKLDTYIFIESFPEDNEDDGDPIHSYLLQHQSTLMARHIRSFHEKNWFEWGAPRNIAAIRQHWGKECLFVYNMTRQPKVAFVNKVQYFGGNLLMLVPKKDAYPHNLIHKVAALIHKTEEYLNSEAFRKQHTFSGRFKIGHRELSLSCLSFACE